MLRNNSKKNKSPERAISFRHWTTLESTTNSDYYEDIDWKPISRHQRTRKPINLSGHHRALRRNTRIQDWVNFNIKSLGDTSKLSTNTSHDSDSGFEQPSSRNEYHSLYIEPWTNCHEDREEKCDLASSNEKVRIFVSGPNPEESKKKLVTKKVPSYKSSGPNDERFYVSEKPSVTSVQINNNPQYSTNNNNLQKRRKKQCAPQPPGKRSIGLQTEESALSLTNTMNKKTYLFATSSNEMAFPNSMPPAMSSRKLENGYNHKNMSSMVVEDPQIPEPDYSPIIIRKISSKHQQQPKMKKEIQRKSNLDLWGNAARYKGSLEELDQESPDESQSSGNNSRVKDLAEKLKHQSERDQRRRQQRIEKKDYVSLRPTPGFEDSGNSRMSSRRSSSEEREVPNEAYLSDSFSMLSMSTSNIPNHYSNRMSQYSQSSGWNTMTTTRSNASLNLVNHDEPVSMIPCNHEQSVLQEVKSKQSQFFNSLFPSRANRFGFPVYPERSFGIPSQMNVPISFAGFSPAPSGTQSMMLPPGYNMGEEDKGESSSILSEIPKLLLGRKKKYSMKKKQGIFGLF